jgi:hypothetical protein
VYGLDSILDLQPGTGMDIRLRELAKGGVGLP